MIHHELLSKLMKVNAEEKRILDGEALIDKSIYMESSGDVIKSQKILSAGKLIDIRPHTRFAHFPAHSHDYVEIVYMCSGTTTHIINGRQIVLREGELLFLCQGAVQEILPAGINDIGVNFIVRPNFFDTVLAMMGEEDTPLRRFVVDCLKNSRDNKGYLHFEVSDVLPVQNLVENLIWTLINETPNKRNINQTAMGLLFLILINHTDRLFCGESEDITVRILEYIEDNYKNGSLGELSKLLHYDISTLSREIKNKTGKKYTELVQEKRLSQACFLLKNTDMTVKEISEKTGYENVSFFYRIFKEQYGVSPKKYRKSNE